MRTSNFVQTMNDGTKIQVNRWLPDDDENIKGVVVLSHGMLEHSLRYDRTASILAENGWVFQGHDHRGHGRTALMAKESGTGDFGFLSDKNGYLKVVTDLETLVLKAREDFPGKKIVLFGHSFGSFVSQFYIERNKGMLSGCILSGTSGPQNGTARMGKTAIAFYTLFHSDKTRSAFVNNLAFGSYMKRIKNPESKYAWLSTDKDMVKMYEQDQWCGGIPTVSFFSDLTSLLLAIHKKSNMKKIDADLPVFFMSGTEDPVGNYTKSVKKLISIYRKNGLKKIDAKFYEGIRHEPLNDVNRDQAVSDILKWLNSTIID